MAVAGGRACVPRARAAGLSLSQCLQTMLQQRGQGNSLGPAPPSSQPRPGSLRWRAGRSLEKGGGEAGVVAEAATATAALGPSCLGPAPSLRICAWPRPLTRAGLYSRYDRPLGPPP